MADINSKISKGLLGTKLGMTQVWDDNGRLVPVTVVAVGTNVVTQVRSAEADGYAAVQLAFGAIDPRKVNKPRTGHFEKAGVTPRRYLAELRTTDADSYELGQEVTAEVFEAGTVVDATGTSKGKGTAGVMKRHGFGGLGASHGTQRKHRSPGSIGGCATPARVTPRRHVVELRTEDAAEYELGQEITVEVFEAGQRIDVTGRSKGKGTAGVMKRHGFKGLGASHGTQRKHRSPGSIGGCATPGRVFKGLRMAGRHGNTRTTVQNLTVHAIDADKGLLLIKGAVPGPNGGLILVRSAAKGAN